MSRQGDFRTGTCETAVRVPAARSARLGKGPREQNPYEIDDEELASVLAELLELSRVPPEELAALEEAEVPSLWFL